MLYNKFAFTHTKLPSLKFPIIPNYPTSTQANSQPASHAGSFYAMNWSVLFIVSESNAVFEMKFKCLGNCGIFDHFFFYLVYGVRNISPSF